MRKERIVALPQNPNLRTSLDPFRWPKHKHKLIASPNCPAESHQKPKKRILKAEEKKANILYQK